MKRIYQWTVVLLAAVFVLLMPNVSFAESPPLQDIAAARLAQEPALVCVAFETGLSAEPVALAKVRFDSEFGFAHGITTSDQWAATYGDRMQFFTDDLGVPNPTRDGAPLPWCKRLVDARAKVLAVWNQ